VDRRIAGIARSPLDLPTAGHSFFRAVGPMYDLAKYSSRDGGATYTEKRWTSSFDYGVGAERYQRNLIDYSVQFAAWFRLRDEILSGTYTRLGEKYVIIEDQRATINP
jgi:hypothetical protein